MSDKGPQCRGPDEQDREDKCDVSRREPDGIHEQDDDAPANRAGSAEAREAAVNSWAMATMAFVLATAGVGAGALAIIRARRPTQGADPPEPRAPQGRGRWPEVRRCRAGGVKSRPTAAATLGHMGSISRLGPPLTGRVE